MRRSIILVLFISAASSSAVSDCKCARPAPGETTHWGGNEMIVVVEEKSYKREGALVEVFTHPEYLLTDSPSPQGTANQERIAILSQAPRFVVPRRMSAMLNCQGTRRVCGSLGLRRE